MELHPIVLSSEPRISDETVKIWNDFYEHISLPLHIARQHNLAKFSMYYKIPYFILKLKKLIILKSRNISIALNNADIIYPKKVLTEYGEDITELSLLYDRIELRSDVVHFIRTYMKNQNFKILFSFPLITNFNHIDIRYMSTHISPEMDIFIYFSRTRENIVILSGADDENTIELNIKIFNLYLECADFRSKLEIFMIYHFERIVLT